MSRRRIYLCALQKSFLDEESCLGVANAVSSDIQDERPQKRRRVASGGDGWGAILEIDIECAFVEGSSPSSSPATSCLDTPPIAVVMKLENTVMTVLNPSTCQPLFAFVCQDFEAATVEKIMWFQRLSAKDCSIARCVRMSTSLSIRHNQHRLESSTICFRLEIRFDHNVSQVARLSVKDRIGILDYAFGKASTKATADHFYSNLGQLSKEYIYGENEDSLQHPLISCRLFPFQKRAVAWMLYREGKSPGRRPGAYSDQNNLPSLWERLTDLNQKPLYINRHQGFSTLDQSWVLDTFARQTILGGILAEVYFSMKQLMASRRWG